MYHEICLPNDLSGAWRHTEGTLLQWTTILLSTYQEHFLRKQSLIDANGQDTCIYQRDLFFQIVFFLDVWGYTEERKWQNISAKESLVAFFLENNILRK